MKKNTITLCKGLALATLAFLHTSADAQTSPSQEMTSEEAKSLYTSSVSVQRTSVHDPSIIWDENGRYYYIFGSHMATARTRDLQNWEWTPVPWNAIDTNGKVTDNATPADAFHIHETKTVTIGGKSVAFGNYDAAAWNCALPGTDEDNKEFAWTVDGNMWAPDIIYNPVMKKWCQYLSLNGPRWNSCIILLTADAITGPYVYQGPVVFTGFLNDTDERISFHKTDLELVIGEQQSLPARYRQNAWGDYWPHAIDPTVFYDEDGKLWMAYGSWSGGIYMLELNEENGLRDYDVQYASDYDTKKQQVTSDPYFGKKIAGGCYVSGEGPYIEHIGNHYYLFMSYGGYAPDGGYEMRVFRSTNPDGPYKDMAGTDAIFTGWRLNFGVNADKRGEKIMGAYNHWGFMTVGECAQGHNSVLAAPDGNTYLVYHTKFNDGTVGHQVRVHQLYLNSDGWPVAAPFEYHGEKVGDEEIATTAPYQAEEVAGTYKLLNHKYSMNHAEYEEVTPVEVTLHTDGTVSGAYRGTWSVNGNNAHITLTMGNITYKGVVVRQQMEPSTIKAVCFTACSNTGVNVWGYRMEDRYALAYAINNLEVPITENQYVTKNLDLYGIECGNGVQVKWTSDTPDAISHTGRYNPAGLTGNTPVRLTLELSCGDHYWTKSYKVSAKAESLPNGDWQTGMKAYYGFDQSPFVNAYNTAHEAKLMAQGVTKKPTLEKDSLRTGNVLHQYFGASGSCSFTQMPNPLYQEENLEGVTVAMWIKRTDDVPWDAIWSFYNSSANQRLYFTGNSYLGFNNGSDWFDINHPGAVISDNIPIGEWAFVSIVLSKENGCDIYVNSSSKSSTMTFAGNCNGTDLTAKGDFEYSMVMDFIRSCPNFYLGYGSFWGSVDVRVDDLIIYNRALSRTDIRALNTMSNRVTDFTTGPGGTSIKEVKADIPLKKEGIYDLSGRKVENPSKGIYIVNGKKKLIN